MADDFDVLDANVALTGAGDRAGRSHRSISLTRALGSAAPADSREQLDELKRKNKEKQDLFRKLEEQTKRQEHKMANAWLKHLQERRQARKEDAEKSNPHGTEQVKQKAVAMHSNSRRKGKIEPAVPYIADQPKEDEEKARRAERRESLREQLHTNKKILERSLQQVFGQGKQAQQQKSVKEEAQGIFQGLMRSADGRKILEASSKQQKNYREALIKGDAGAVELAEEELEASDEEVAEPKEVQKQSDTKAMERHLLRRSRLRKMSQITTKVLQSKQEMSKHMLPPLSPFALPFVLNDEEVAKASVAEIVAKRMPELT